ncbi:MAG: prepilin-type N-terminal cleavage/methylation domain-containing protein [Candidatus Saccharimonas sp.]
MKSLRKLLYARSDMTRKSVQGFTIVELLIVIVVIAILAAITIVSYNGVQSRSRTSSGAVNAANIVKKAELYNGLYGNYPTYCQFVTNTSNPTGGVPTAGTGLGSANACVAGATPTGAEVNIPNINVLTAIAVTSVTAANGSVITYIKCPGSGAKIGYFDYTGGAITYKTAGDQTGC